MKTSSRAAGARAAADVGAYLLRALLPLALLYALLLRALQRRTDLVADPLGPLALVAELDLLRVLCYALLPAALLFLLAPAQRRNGPAWSGAAAATALAVGLLMLYLPQRGLGYIRPGVRPPAGHAIASIVLGLNAALLLYFHAAGCWDERLRRAVRRSVVVADLLAPSLVWAAYRADRGRWFGPLRLLPCLFACSLVIAPWLAAPAPSYGNPRVDPALTRLAVLSSYQALLTPDGDALIATTDDERLCLVDARGRGLRLQLQAPSPQIQALAYDSANDELVFADPYEGRLLRLDRRTLETRLDAPIAGHPLRMEGNYPWRTLAIGSDRLLSYCAEWIALMDQGGLRFRAANVRTNAHALPDESGAIIYLTAWHPGRLIGLSLENLSERFRLPLPGLPERLALDRAGQRLFVTLPLSGQVAVIDLERRVEIDRIATFPGVRVAAIDEQRGLLLLAGFSPVLELRDLRDFRLIKRLAAPPWVRWIELDQQRGRAYLSAARSGIYALDLERAVDPTWRGRLERLDPFYVLSGAAARLALTRLDRL